VLDLLVEAVPSPAKKPLDLGIEADGSAAFVFKTIADPFAGRINVFRVLAGDLASDSNVVNVRNHGKERVGQLLVLQGKDHVQTEKFVAGDIGAVSKLKETMTGDLLLASDKPVDVPSLQFPQPVMSFAVSPKTKGDEEKAATALRRLAEEDPTLVLRRDEQTGEQLLAGMSQMHVEVAIDRIKRRFGVDIELHQPRVPYLETIRKESRAQGRYKKQTGGRGQFGDCHIVLEPIPGHEGYEFVDKIVGGVIPQGFRPAVDKGIQEAMGRGELAGAPVQGVRVLLVDGSYHSVDSSEMAFKIAGSMAFKNAALAASPVLLEPLMKVEVVTPEDYMGDVMGDLNRRRGIVQGMEDAPAGKIINAHVPLSEMFGYATDLRSQTQGRATYTMEFDHYAEAPASVADEIIKKTA
jgi:elongation factor G